MHSGNGNSASLKWRPMRPPLSNPMFFRPDPRKIEFPVSLLSIYRGKTLNRAPPPPPPKPRIGCTNADQPPDFIPHRDCIRADLISATE